MPNQKPQLRAPEARSLHRDQALPAATQNGPQLTATRHTSTAVGPPGPAVPHPPEPPRHDSCPQASEDNGGEIRRHSDVIGDGTGVRLLVEMESRLNQELEDAWICHLLGEDGDLFVEENYIGRVVDFFVGDGVDTEVVWSYKDRIEWRVEDVDTTTSGNRPWWMEDRAAVAKTCGTTDRLVPTGEGFS